MFHVPPGRGGPKKSHSLGGHRRFNPVQEPITIFKSNLNSNLTGVQSNLIGIQSNLIGIQSNLIGIQSNLIGIPIPILKSNIKCTIYKYTGCPPDNAAQEKLQKEASCRFCAINGVESVLPNSGACF
jgi:hypothetical protein